MFKTFSRSFLMCSFKGMNSGCTKFQFCIQFCMPSLSFKLSSDVKLRSPAYILSDYRVFFAIRIVTKNTKLFCKISKAWVMFSSMLFLVVLLQKHKLLLAISALPNKSRCLFKHSEMTLVEFSTYYAIFTISLA